MEIASIILSSITAIAAIVALFLTIIEIKKGNKQKLFDDRLKDYQVLKELVFTYKENISVLGLTTNTLRNEPDHAIDLTFKWLCNNRFLEAIQPIIDKALESESQRQYLLKMDEMDKIAEEIRLIFPKRISIDMWMFIDTFRLLLISIYKYKVALNSISKELEHNEPFPESNELEKKCRSAIIKNCENIASYYSCIVKKHVLEKAVKTIQL